MNDVFDIRWRLQSGSWIPLQNQYPLLAALSRVVPEIHRERRLGIHPIRGLRLGPGMLKITNCSALTVRTPIDLLPRLMRLAGRQLDLGGQSVRLGVPEIVSLFAADRLYSHIVTIKGFMEAKAFADAVLRQLDMMGVRRCAALSIGKRRVIEVKDRTIVGFHVRLGGLTTDESLRLQVDGLGGRRHLGCGLFLADNL